MKPPRKTPDLIKNRKNKISGTQHEDPNTFVLLQTVRNILYHEDSPKGIRCCDTVAKFSGFALLLATYVAKQ